MLAHVCPCQRSARAAKIHTELVWRPETARLAPSWALKRLLAILFRTQNQEDSDKHTKCICKSSQRHCSNQDACVLRLALAFQLLPTEKRLRWTHCVTICLTDFVRLVEWKLSFWRVASVPISQDWFIFWRLFCVLICKVGTWKLLFLKLVCTELQVRYVSRLRCWICVLCVWKICAGLVCFVFLLGVCTMESDCLDGTRV